MESFEKGQRHRNIMWTNGLHRAGDISITLGNEYKMIQPRNSGKSSIMKCYDHSKIPKIPLGLSVILPEDLPHNVRVFDHQNLPCFILEDRLVLPPELGLAFTHSFELPFPSRKDPTRVELGHHFVIYPAEAGLNPNTFLDKLRNLNWVVCNFKANGLPKSLLIENEEDNIDLQLDRLKDYRLHLVHRVAALAYDNTKSPTDRILLFEIYHWILKELPSYVDFLNNEFRCRFIYFYAMKRRSLDESAQYLLVDLDEHFKIEDPDLFYTLNS